MGHNIDPRARAPLVARELEKQKLSKSITKSAHLFDWPQGKFILFSGRIWSESLRKKRIRCLCSYHWPKHPSRLSSRRNYSILMFFSVLSLFSISLTRSEIYALSEPTHVTRPVIGPYGEQSLTNNH